MLGMDASRLVITHDWLKLYLGSRFQATLSAESYSTFYKILAYFKRRYFKRHTCLDPIIVSICLWQNLNVKDLVFLLQNLWVVVLFLAALV